MDQFETFVSLFLVLVLFTDLLAAYLLLRGAADSEYSVIALNERAFVATVQGISAGLVACVAANRLLNWHLPSEVVLISLSAALLIQALPGIVWLYIFFTGGFKGRVR